MEEEINYEKYESQEILPDFLVANQYIGSEIEVMQSLSQEEIIKITKNIQNDGKPQPSSSRLDALLNKQTERVDIVRLRKLLAWTSLKDRSTFEKLLFYYECFCDRTESCNPSKFPVSLVQVTYHYAQSKVESKIGRVYSFVQSFFSSQPKRFGGLQTLPKIYRGYLSERIYILGFGH